MGGLPKCNSTLEDENIVGEEPIWHGHTFHHIGLFVSAICGMIAILVSFYLIFMHATHYLRPYEQRHIIRILLMVPVYAAVSFLSYYDYQHSIYYEVVRDCYEAFAIASFFTLLCHYLEVDLHRQKEYFRKIKPRPWIWPIPWLQKCWGGKNGIWRTPRSGLTWFNILWAGVFQYCFIRVFMTCTAVITQALGRYCQETLNPLFAHVWIMCLEAVAVTIAMYCIIQFFLQVKDEIQEHKPLLKVAAIKLVIFLSFWQTILISFLTSTGAIKPSKKIQTPDISVGIPAMLLCIEMSIFAVFHMWAFSWKPYSVKSTLANSEFVPGESLSSKDYKGGFLGVTAILEAFNPWDLVKAVGRSARWLFVRRKKRTDDPSYIQTNNESTLDLGSSGDSGNKLNTLQQNTAYGGGGFDTVSPAENPPQYEPRKYHSENQVLLKNAQSNPVSQPRGIGGSGDNSTGTSTPTGDLGIAKSGFETDDDAWDSSSNNEYSQALPHGGQRNLAGSESAVGNQEALNTSPPYPYPVGEHFQNNGNRASMPHFSPPPTMDEGKRSSRK